MNEEIQNIIDQYPILKDCKGIEKDEFLIINKEYVRQTRKLDQHWFFRNITKEFYFTNLEIA